MLGTMFYEAAVWDPWLIVSQIIFLQCLYYLTLGLFMCLLVGTRISPTFLVHFFDYSTLTTSTITGWFAITPLLLTAVAGFERVPLPYKLLSIQLNGMGFMRPWQWSALVYT